MEVETVLGTIHLCPRCHKQYIPRTEHAGQYPGALSRVYYMEQRCVEICSICGEDEAMEAMTLGRYTPIGEWPVADWLDITKELEAATKQFKEMQAQGLIPGTTQD